jgi:ubiquinone/menaquinone biosynthesis C-methylase UbiE
MFELLKGDVSEKQIEHAKKKYSDVEFKVGPGENLQFLENCSVNLITTAQAMHWMNHDAFYREVDTLSTVVSVLFDA